MTKHLTKILCVLVVAVMCLSASFIFAGCDKAPEGEADKVSDLTLPDNGRIRVLQLTDLHLTKGKSLKQDKETLRWVEEAIERSEPDIVAVTGDAVGGAWGRDKALIQLANIFEEKEVYWMYTLGNHDGEWSVATKTEVGKDRGEVGNKELVELLKGYKYSLMVEGDTDGVGNYVINYVDGDGKVAFSFVNMDTFGKFSAEGGPTPAFENKYMGLTTGQVQWYRDQMNGLKARTADGEVPPSAMFMHVPLVEFRDAYYNRDDYPFLGSDPINNIESDVYAPPISVDGVEYPNCGMFDAIKEIGSTKLVSVGHDHAFAWRVDYNDVFFNYAYCSGVNAWDRRVDVAATVIEIDTNAKTKEGMFTFSQIKPYFEYSSWEGKTWQ